MTLAEYVRRRQGVPLGHRDSLRNMLVRSFGAGSYAQFWRYWNPIWGYYLSKTLYRPLRRVLPQWLATLLTFTGSGLIHDIAVGAIMGKWQLLCGTWFILIGLVLLISEKARYNYADATFLGRSAANAAPTLATLTAALALTG